MTRAWRFGLCGLLGLGLLLGSRDAGADPTAGLGDFANGEFAEGASGNASVQSVTGAMRYTYRFELAPERGAIQPSLALTYDSALKDREAGLGWGLDLPTIELRPLSGFPEFEADGIPKGEERYSFSGRPLVRQLHSKQPTPI